jgi:accessory gene regulator protein AgrB
MDARFDHINTQEKQKQAFEQQIKLQREKEAMYDEIYRVAIIFGVGFVFGLVFNVIFF